MDADQHRTNRAAPKRPSVRARVQVCRYLKEQDSPCRHTRVPRAVRSVPISPIRIDGSARGRYGMPGPLVPVMVPVMVMVLA